MVTLDASANTIDIKQGQDPEADARKLSYDAAEDTGRRRTPSVVLGNEERHANERQRRILSSNARDLERNFAIAAWAIRRHLDYVSTFSFQSFTGDKGFDDYYEATMSDQMKRQNFDVANRHNLWRAVRISEAMAAKDGDVAWLKIRAGGHRGKIQAIESDRIATPSRRDLGRAGNSESWSNGCKLTPYYATTHYAIHDREKRGNGLKLNKIVAARNVLHHGYFGRFDQCRGLSPINSSLNWYRDTYEAFEYTFAKVKLDQMFGLAFSRDGEGPVFGGAEATIDTDGDGQADSGYEIKLDKPGPFAIDLNPGDKVEMLSGKTPAAETVNFLKLGIHISLKSLDIPYSFFDESFTNFYGSRGGLIQYLKACKEKIANLTQFLNDWMRWKASLMILDGSLVLPRGKDFSFLRWSYIPQGVPWWDPVKEARGAAMAIAMGVSNPYRECHAIGTNFENNIDQTARAIEYAKEKGVTLTFADKTAFKPEINTGAEDDEK